jgi:hypothetical protein
MTLTAYDGTGAFLGQQHWTAQFAEGAILGSIAFPGMRYVAFNYTNTNFGFYGIDNLEFERAPGVTPEPSGLFVLGVGLTALAARRKRKISRHDGPPA